jgi:hypothetical protein
MAIHSHTCFEMTYVKNATTGCGKGLDTSLIDIAVMNVWVCGFVGSWVHGL